MQLTSQEKAILHSYLGLLLDADEPLAFLGAFRRVAELKAFSAIRGKVGPEEGQRWSVLADALARTEKDIHMFLERG